MTTLHCHDHSKQSIWCPSRTQAANVALLNVIPGTQMLTKDKSIQKFKKIFLLIYQFRNEREAGEKTAPWNAIVLGLLLLKKVHNRWRAWLHVFSSAGQVCQAGWHCRDVIFSNHTPLTSSVRKAWPSLYFSNSAVSESWLREWERSF